MQGTATIRGISLSMPTLALSGRPQAGETLLHLLPGQGYAAVQALWDLVCSQGPEVQLAATQAVDHVGRTCAQVHFTSTLKRLSLVGLGCLLH